MKQILAAVVSQLDLQPVDPAPERVARRLITLTPAGRTLVQIACRIAPTPPPLAAVQT